jgi:antitoxin (DNA-binding transcriptional repressor) of toxin-antitoxin stability system
MLHEKTGQLLDRARQGERFRLLRQGRAEAFLIPAAQAVDPEWPEIMAAVWKAQQKPGPRPPATAWMSAPFLTRWSGRQRGQFSSLAN